MGDLYCPRRPSIIAVNVNAISAGISGSRYCWVIMKTATNRRRKRIKNTQSGKCDFVTGGMTLPLTTTSLRQTTPSDKKHSKVVSMGCELLLMTTQQFQAHSEQPKHITHVLDKIAIIFFSPRQYLSLQNKGHFRLNTILDTLATYYS